MGGGASTQKYASASAPNWFDPQPEEETEQDSPTSYEINQAVENKPGSFIGQHYMFDDAVLHRSNMVIVRRIVHKSSKRHRALKQVVMKELDDGVDEMRRQVNVMHTIGEHPNIIKLYETFVDRQKYYFVFEYCAGGKLTTHIDEAWKTKDCHTEREASCVLQQMFRALAHMHSKCVCHRDIRPEHVLIAAQGSLVGCNAKVIDVGCAKETFNRGQQLTEKVGKPYYRAPEMEAGCYTECCDLWSCGVVMYLLLVGYPKARSNKERDKGSKGSKSPAKGVRILDEREFQFRPSDWNHISERARRMLSGLLEEDVYERFTAEQVVEDDWIIRQGPQPYGSRVQLAVSSQEDFPRMRYLEHVRDSDELPSPVTALALVEA